MTRSRWIAYVGAFRFPEGEAGSRRVYGVARSLIEAGYSVTVGSGESQPTSVELLYEDGHGDLSHVGLAEMPDRSLPMLRRTAHWLVTLGSRTVTWLNKQPDKPACVIYYGYSAAFALRLLVWCRRHQIPLIFDVVEWYDPAQMLGGRFGPLNASAKMSLRLLFPMGGNVIAISSYLEAYYQLRGCLTVRVPPTLDVRKIDARLSIPPRSHSPLILAYTGVPGKKDLINNVIEAVVQIDPTGRMVRLIMAGPTPDQVLATPVFRSRRVSTLPECISAVGRQPHASAMDLVRNADFMPLLRPPLRYAQAGFPTKVPESLAVGTPIICNLTSDLGEHIHDGYEGLVCRNHTAQAFAESLERGLLLSPQQRMEMRYAARQRARLAFDFRQYAARLSAFIDRVQVC